MKNVCKSETRIDVASFSAPKNLDENEPEICDFTASKLRNFGQP